MSCERAFKRITGRVWQIVPCALSSRSQVRSLYCIFMLYMSGCYKITTVFSHAQTVVVCAGCSTVLCQPTGGKARLTEGLLINYCCMMSVN